MIELRKAHRITEFADKERADLKRPWVEGTQLVATNGRILVAVDIHGDPVSAAPFLLPPEADGLMAPRSFDHLSISRRGDTLTLAAYYLIGGRINDARARVDSKEVKAPIVLHEPKAWKQLVPERTKGPGTRASFNPKYLAQCLLHAGKFAGAVDVQLQASDLDPVRIDAIDTESMVRALYCIMPIKI